MTLRTRISTLSILTLLLAGCASDPAADPSADAAALLPEAERLSIEVADRFQTQLMAKLNAAITDKGAEHAVEVCAIEAPAIARQLSEESGAMVRRTALRARNPDARPDATEEKIMTGWLDAPLDDEGRPQRWTAQEDGDFRFMRAIPAMPMCLTCHGDDIAPAVQQAIQAHYPEDQATGFAEGDLRGAFSIRWTETALKAALPPDTEADAP